MQSSYIPETIEKAMGQSYTVLVALPSPLYCKVVSVLRGGRTVSLCMEPTRNSNFTFHHK